MGFSGLARRGSPLRRWGRSLLSALALLVVVVPAAHALPPAQPDPGA